MPKISVIVPIYDAEIYLEQCVDSILNQTFKDLDIILVDDGSKDHSGAMCDSYGKQDERVQVVHKENGGLVSARKAGFQVAKGEYIAFVDADDWLEPDMYEKLINIVTTTQAQIICSNYVREDSGIQTFVKNQMKSGLYEEHNIENQMIPNMICFENYFFDFGINPVVWCKLFQRETIGKALEVMDNHISYGEDVCLSFMAILNAKSVYIDEKCFGYHYRIIENSMSHEFSEKFYDRVYYLYDFLKEHVGGKREDVCRQLRYYFVWNIYNGIFREFSKQCDFDKKKRKQDLVKHLTNDTVKSAIDDSTQSIMPKDYLKIYQHVNKGQVSLAVLRIYMHKLRLRLGK